MRKVLKRSLSLLLAITIIIGSAYVGLSEVDFGSVFAVEAKALDVGAGDLEDGWWDDEPEDDLSEYLTFELNSDGKSYSVSRCQRDVSGEIVIPSHYNDMPVITIGHLAFYSCIGLTSVSIPNTVTAIESDAFFNCTNLKSLIIPDSVTEIGAYAFYNCGISSVEFGSGLKTIGHHAFLICSNLTSVTFPDGLTSIGDNAFGSCGRLVVVEIPGSVNYFGLDVFNASGLSRVYYLGTKEQYLNIVFENNPTLFKAIWNVSFDYDFDDEGLELPEFQPINEPRGIFSVVHEEKSQVYSFEYNDKYFDGFATEYNHDLATMSLCLALSTFQSQEEGVSYHNAEKLLLECGFKNIVPCNYGDEDEPYETYPDGVACVIANKKIGDETLIAVAVRSGGYEKEWASNLTLGYSGDHQGFNKAANDVKNNIKAYINQMNTDNIENNDITGNVKFWLTGYSRGAATATQTAAKLNFTSIENVTFTKNDIYAYGFATPAGAIEDSDPTNLAKYGNIFNIINFHDIVPRVAPDLWGFGRYGKTYYLPFSENSWGSTLEKEQEVIDWFDENGLDYRVDEFIPVYSDIAISPVPISNDTLGVFCEKLINDIALSITFRFIYTTNLQNTLRAIWTENPDITAPLAIKKVIEILGNEVLLKPQYVITAIGANSKLAEAHAKFGAYYLGWMEKIPEDRALDYLNNGETRHWLFNCPVDVYVYDKSGTLVAAIENDLAVEIEDTPFSYGVDENGQKYFYLPIDAEYDIKVIAREDCETTCTVNELSAGSFDESRVVTYTEIPMVEDEALSVSTSAYSEDDIINGTEEGSSAEYTIQKETGEVLEPNVDVAGEEIENYTYNVTVEYDETKGIVYGGGEFTIGQFCQVVAENKPGYKFSKWTVNGETVSTESTYRFAVKEDVTIVAEYEFCEHPTWITEAVAVTCTEDGYTKHTCDVCTYSYNDNIVESTGHNYQWCETVTPTTSQSGLKQYICLICENVGRSEMLPILSGFNFVATDVSSYSLASYNGIATEVKIPSKHNNCAVTTVGSSCFKGNENITRVEIPVGVTSIGYLAFYECTALDTVSIPATVTSIGAQAFYGFKGTIICQKDSFAHQYALENGIDYIIPTLRATNSKSFIDFEHQFVFSTITKCKNIDDIIVGPPTMLTLPTASLKSNGGDFYGTGSTITMFDGNTFMGDYVLVINGDINGDSACDALDAAQVALVSNGQKTIDGAYAMAADSNLDDEINIEDYQAIVNKVVA